jgi:hypothetical protein
MGTLATDNFDRADAGTLGSNWTTGGEENTFGIVSNKASADGPNDAAAYYNAVTWPNDQYSQTVLATSKSSTADEGVGVMVRHAAGTTRAYYRAVFAHGTTNNVGVSKFTNPTYTNLGKRNTGSDWTNDAATGYIEVQGSTIVIKLNGTTLGASFSDSAVTAGSAGLNNSGDSGTPRTQNNWEGGDFGAAAQDTPELYGRPAGQSGQRQMHQLLAT